MGITHLSGLEVAGVPTMGVNGLPSPFTGNYFFVNETTGADGNAGQADSPMQTLSAALGRCTAGNNDVVLFSGTIHLSASLAWAKSQTHLIGIGAPLRRGKRARISVTGSTAFNKMVDTTSASGCYFGNFGTFYGFNSASNNAICWYEAGGRNCYDNVEFMGFGDGTVTTGTSNIAAARALTISGSTGENSFYSCVLGVDTVTRNGTNYTMEINGGSPRNHFENCEFEAYLGSSGAASAHLLIGASGIDRYLRFKDCYFRNATKSGATAMTQVMSLNAAIGGTIELSGSTGFDGATNWEASTTNQAFITGATPSGTGGKATNNT